MNLTQIPTGGITVWVQQIVLSYPVSFWVAALLSCVILAMGGLALLMTRSEREDRP